MVAIAAEQWESANQSVETFSRLGHRASWSRRHAFLADMGGIRIKAPDLDEPLPVTSYQLAWLVEHQHLPMPGITLAMVDDKDRNDGFARAATLVQIIWFPVQCVGRWIQGIGLTTFELTTVAFILCTLHTFFFWFDKPQDVEVPFDIQTTRLISEMLARQQPNAQNPSPRAWLSAVQAPPDPRSLTTPFWFGVGAVFGTKTRSSPDSTWRFENSQTTPPKGITTPQMLYGILFELAYFGMHLVGWILVFPTTVERVLWTTASLTLLGLLLLYLSAWAIGQRVAPAAARFLFHQDATTIIEIATLFPRWAQIVIHAPVIVIYVLARGYILV
ncbi:hypothetical protein BDW42DRAFT_169621 [Aspergillus taichungensis]|uniref:Uncharacterized protein n=1 Tax=Aspergillus taichungensis TaxID=482145 RepID=A0A2J5HUZ5_9EURO|nr:hypothetical protein BDW42DRAFT_169621 [Aspergillus taichungensis]